MVFCGRCHCGAIQIALTLKKELSEANVHACSCNFCRQHCARTVTDPDGMVQIILVLPEYVRRYRFEMNTADYLICTRCGAYAAAVIETASGWRATVNTNLLENSESFGAPSPVSYENETRMERIARRAKHWMPASLH